MQWDELVIIMLLYLTTSEEWAMCEEEWATCSVECLTRSVLVAAYHSVFGGTIEGGPLYLAEMSGFGLV